MALPKSTPNNVQYYSLKFYAYNNTVESRDYAPPPFVHASIGQKWGGGLYAGALHFRVTTITDRRMPRGRVISVLSLAV